MSDDKQTQTVDVSKDANVTGAVVEPTAVTGEKRDRANEAPQETATAPPSATTAAAEGAQQEGEDGVVEQEEPLVKKRKVSAIEEAVNGTNGANDVEKVNGTNLNAVETQNASKTEAAAPKEHSAADTSSVPSARDPPPTSTVGTDGPPTDSDPLIDAPQKPEVAPGDDEHLKHPERWTTGDEAATSKQKGFIAVLEKKSGDAGPNGVTGGEGMTKAEASERIEELKEQTS